MATSVASLKATLDLSSEGFTRGLADADAKLKAFNADLKEQGVSTKLANSASRDYAKQLYNEAKSVDQVNASHGRLNQTLVYGQQHWKGLAIGAGGAATAILALTGNLGALSPLLSGAIAPLTAMSAILVGMVSPLTALVTLFGAVGAGAGFGLYSALTSNNKAFDNLQNRVGNMKHMFGDLGDTLGKRFLPYINSGVTAIENFIKYADKLAHMSLPQVIQSISTQGMHMLEHINQSIYNLIGKPIMQIFSASFGGAGNKISGAFAHMFDVWKPLVGKMWNVFASWFDKQHFSATGVAWASAMVNTALPVILHAFAHGLESVFSSESMWGKIGMIAGGYFAANFLTGGLLNGLGKGLGKILLGRLGAGAAADGVGAGEAAGGAATAGGVGAGLIGAIGVGAIVAAVIPAALFYLSTRSHPSALTNIKAGNTAVSPKNPNSPIYLGAPALNAYGKDVDIIHRLATAEAALNQQINFGGKSAQGWQDAWKSSTKTAGDAQRALQDLRDKGIISAGDATKAQKANLDTFINQQDAIARKATAASHNVSTLGPAARAQEAHVAALARTSAQLAAAINSIPSRKYVDLVVSITENLKTQGNAPGQGRGVGASGGIITGGVQNKDSVPMMLMPGEVVLSKPAVASLGGMHAANSLNPNGQLLGMANGGGIYKPPSTAGMSNAALEAHYRQERALEKAATERLRKEEKMYNHLKHPTKRQTRMLARMQRSVKHLTTSMKTYSGQLKTNTANYHSVMGGIHSNAKQYASNAAAAGSTAYDYQLGGHMEQGGVTVQQFFTSSPNEPFVAMRRAAFAASAIYG